ncbi:hypothetical protein [Pseudomonas jessenii]|uniref:Uncharacterized protein n=1 Tax=Pseudomonas jessenii TaxID=77298 RepID=A0A370S7U4_PSEJE|nr:hypothetical protein [Pseudomonas jessenii]RDL15764.1 hypothetical protein DEU51_11524 [Pseudomonas jessenii]
MGNIKDITDDVTHGAKLAKSFAQRAALKPWSRLLLMSIMGILVMGSYLVYLTLLVRDYGKNTDDYLTEYNLLHKQSRDQRALDYIDVCIDASKNNDVNKDYYCQDAVAFYRDAFEGLPNSKIEENIKRSAYGTMKVEIAVKLRATALERIDQKSPRMNEILTFMLSNIGMGLVCLAGILTMLATVITTNRLSPPRQS